MESPINDTELEGLLGHKQKTNFVIEQVGDSYVVTQVGELEREDQWEAMRNRGELINNPTYDCYKGKN